MERQLMLGVLSLASSASSIGFPNSARSHLSCSVSLTSTAEKLTGSSSVPHYPVALQLRLVGRVAAEPKAMGEPLENTANCCQDISRLS